jgi:hypothetical protein
VCQRFARNAKAAARTTQALAKIAAGLAAI